MAIIATGGKELTVNPTKVRYSFSLDCLGSNKRGWLQLQRSDHREDGTWLDDPSLSARKSVPMVMGTALDGLLALLPTILSALGTTTTYTDYRLQVRGTLDNNGVLDVSLNIQMLTANGWIAKRCGSLMAFLQANPGLIANINTAWDALDTAINDANSKENWV